MFNQTMQYMFDRYVHAVETLGNKFDYAKMNPILEKGLVKAGLKHIDTDKFFRAVWRELDKPNSEWQPDPSKVAAFLNVMPYDTLQKKLTDNIVCSRLNTKDWVDFRSPQWVKQKHTARFLTENDLNDGKPVTIVKKTGGKSFAVSVFLGDVREKLGIDSELKNLAYATAYNTIQEEVGKEAITTELKKVFADESFEVINWPNLTNIDEVEYEIVFYPEDHWAETLKEETADEIAATFQALFG